MRQLNISILSMKMSSGADKAKRVLFGLLIGLALIAGLCIENGYNTGVVLICTAILFTMLPAREHGKPS
jgi:hypothetical protein